jgi:hypothetical protein
VAAVPPGWKVLQEGFTGVQSSRKMKDWEHGEGGVDIGGGRAEHVEELEDGNLGGGSSSSSEADSDVASMGEEHREAGGEGRAKANVDSVEDDDEVEDW